MRYNTHKNHKCKTLSDKQIRDLHIRNKQIEFYKQVDAVERRLVTFLIAVVVMAAIGNWVVTHFHLLPL